MSCLRFLLGGLDLSIVAAEEILLPESAAYRPFFVSTDRTIGPGTITVHLVVTEVPRAEGRVIFASDARWSILEKDGRHTLVDRDPTGPNLAVRLQPGTTEVRVECSPAWLVDGRTLRCPIRYPVDQILAMYLLGRQGLLVHAAGARVRGRGIILPGVSGAGKTTFCRLAEGREGWDPLSDDRVIVRVPDDGGGAVVHGTPWPGEGRVASSERAPLERILFLSQGSESSAEPLTPGQALKRLLAASSVPWFDAGPLTRTLEACDRLVRRVPATLLTFRRDQGAVDLVERLVAAEAPPQPPD